MPHIKGSSYLRIIIYKLDVAMRKITASRKVLNFQEDLHFSWTLPTPPIWYAPSPAHCHQSTSWPLQI